ncbi:MAG: hypothetical protein ACR2PJ_07840, partial [Pseudomonadales bacterium]
STIPSQRVMGNLFYRGLRMQAPVYIRDTLTTSTKVVALRQNSIKQGRPASGMVVLEIAVTNQRDETVMHFWRCPMLPCRDPAEDTGRKDDLDIIPNEISDDDLLASLPAWNLKPFSEKVSPRPYKAGDKLLVEARDTVTSAPELVRLTLNMAMTHTDATRSVYDKRLAYGGHTIAVAAAQLARVMPDLVMPLAWYQCDHLAPVFEEDLLQSEVSIGEVKELPQGRLVKLRVGVTACRGDEAETSQVLDWQLAAWLL